MNPFETLQLSPGASAEEAKAAYRLLAKKWHPDKYTGAEKTSAEETFRKITEAYTAIKKGDALNPSATAPDTARPGRVKTPADWLAEAKGALVGKQYETAMSLSQFCFRFPEAAKDARLMYANALEATTDDLKAVARAYEDALKENPDSKEALVKLASLFSALGMPSRAAGMRARAKALGADIKPARPDVCPQPGFSAKTGATGAKTQPKDSDGIASKMADFFRRK